MRHAIEPRREIGQRTIFNLLGPLTNPAGASHQLIGVYDSRLTETVARVLQQLGSKAAFVVHGADGLDELSTTGPSTVSRLDATGVKTYTLDPGEYDLARTNLETLRGDSPAHNAEILRGILAGTERGPRRDIVLLNAAAAIALEDGDIYRGLESARRSIDSGAAKQKLDDWVIMTNDVALSRKQA
jgi:anthranilate phosphoribosyltransferase